MHLRLFGSLQLIDSERPLVHAKARALLVYLLLFPAQVHPREKLVDLLWPEATPEQGRRWLSNTLYELRQSLGQYIVTEEGAIHLTIPTDWQVDVWIFDQLTRNEDTPSLQQAIELYSGDLAPEIYDDWIIAPRLERRENYLTTLETLAERLIAQHQLNEALSYGRRLVWAEPLREHNQQTYLRLLGRLGRRAEALAHYNHLCHLLQTELNIGPLPETQAIAADLRREGDAPPIGSEFLPFVGRAAERTILVQRLERLLGGQGGVIAIEGQPGLGKSRLLRELAASARWRNIVVLSSPGSDRPTESPLGLLQAAFAAALTGPRRVQLELTLPAETLAACAPLVPVWRTRAVLPDLPLAHQRYRFQQALSTVLEEFARLTPVLLLLDDWHWADPSAWEYLDVLVQLAPAYRWLIILTWRRAEMAGRSEWRMVQTWEREGLLTVFALQPWTLAEMTAALPPIHHALAPRLWAISSGNPFLLTEALHALSEGHAPETDVVARAQTLSAESRTVLECATVLGRTIPLAVWVAATGLPPATLATLGDLLIQRYFFYIVEDGYAFAHDLVQTALYQTIPPEVRRYWHGRCAEALAILMPDQYHARAFHLDHADQIESAAALYRQASEYDVHLGAYAEARAALGRALELWPKQPSQSRAEMLLEAARLHFITNEGEAQIVIEEAVRVAATLCDKDLQARAAQAAGELAMKNGQNANARTQLNIALSLAQASRDQTLQLGILDRLGDLAWREGRSADGRELFTQELTLARVLEDRVGEAAALQGLGGILGSSGEQAVALAYLRDAVTICRALGDPFKEAQSLLNLLGAVQASGALDETLTLGAEALAMNERIGYARGAAIVRATLALAQCALGNFVAARQLNVATLDYFSAVNDPAAVALYTGTLGLIVERSGDPTEAERWMSRAIEQLLANGAEFFAALSQMDLGTLWIRAGREAEALPLLEQARIVLAASNAMETQRVIALMGLVYARLDQWEQAEQIATECWQTFQQMPPEGEEIQYNLWALWQLLLSVDRTIEADAILRTAYTALQTQAGRLHDPALRQSFFERVPVNREIVVAYMQLSQTAVHLSARVVRATVPLGRALTEADYVEVRWTVHAPEDEAITDPVERRRFVLRRLLAEAATQRAAPTDGDLAQALGVSRRTILRDMQALAAAGVTSPTRKRK